MMRMRMKTMMMMKMIKMMVVMMMMMMMMKVCCYICNIRHVGIKTDRHSLSHINIDE